MKHNTIKTLHFSSNACTLSQVLKPIRILTKVVFCLPTWMSTEPFEQTKSTGEIVALSVSWVFAVLVSASLGYGVYSFVVLVIKDANLFDIINPMLYVLWNSMPFFMHLFLLCNLSRLRGFFRFLKTSRDRHVLLQQYHAEYDRTAVKVAYVVHLAVQFTSLIGLVIFMLEYPDTPPLLTTITVFQDGPLWYVAFAGQSYLGIYSVAGLLTIDLGIGFFFYCLGLRFRSLTLYAEDCCTEVRKNGHRPVTQFIPLLWNTYEDILKVLERANELLGPLVLANQLNHLTGAVVFTYAGMRSVFLLTASSITVYISTWILFYFRSIIFNYFVSRVNNEHNKLQRSLARLSAAYCAVDLESDRDKMREFSTVKALLNRAQNNVVAVSPLGLYNVTSGTLCAMAGAITAYLVVLLQTKSSGLKGNEHQNYTQEFLMDYLAVLLQTKSSG